MKKIFLFITLFFVIGCVKEKNCENATEGMLVVHEKIDGMKEYPRFYPFYSENKVFFMYIVNKLPKLKFPTLFLTL